MLMTQESSDPDLNLQLLNDHGILSNQSCWVCHNDIHYAHVRK